MINSGEKCNVLIWGTGQMYNKLSGHLNAYKDVINILAFVSSFQEEYSILDGYKVISTDEICEYNFQYHYSFIISKGNYAKSYIYRDR